MTLSNYGNILLFFNFCKFIQLFQLKADDFVDNIKEQNEYRERLEGITKIIRKLNGLMSL
ncbi:unnamed protein product [Brugia pahangi]|uniref:Uncharacterized protein n=1 Tax=Brugia pahangi TaxID=6280 RepID=A0A0N4T2W8_BRUPA|nr:unnamed protein product [Brugia pahangi]